MEKSATLTLNSTLPGVSMTTSHPMRIPSSGSASITFTQSWAPPGKADCAVASRSGPTATLVASVGIVFHFVSKFVCHCSSEKLLKAVDTIGNYSK